MPATSHDRRQGPQTTALLCACTVLSCAMSGAEPVAEADTSSEERARALYAKLEGADYLDERPSSFPTPSAFPGTWAELSAALRQLSESEKGPESDAAEEAVASALQRGGHFCRVIFRTERPGAFVKFRLIGRKQVKEVPRKTNAKVPYSIPIGIYRFWASRDGKPSGPERKLDIICQETVVDLAEGS